MAGRFGGFTLKVKERDVRDDFSSVHQTLVYKLMFPGEGEDYGSRTSFIGSSFFAIAVGLLDLADAVREHGTNQRDH
jgi:hypothetical protein